MTSLDYQSLSPVQRALYQEYVSRRGCEPRPLPDLGEVTEELDGALARQED